MPDRCGNVRRDRLTFELFQAEDGFEEFASSILAAGSFCESMVHSRYKRFRKFRRPRARMLVGGQT